MDGPQANHQLNLVMPFVAYVSFQFLSLCRFHSVQGGNLRSRFDGPEKQKVSEEEQVEAPPAKASGECE